VNGLRGFIAGTIAVASAEVLLTAPGVPGRIGGFGTFLGDVIDRVVNPDLPAVGKLDFVAPPPATFGQTQNNQAGGGSQPKTTRPARKTPRNTVHNIPPRHRPRAVQPNS
jgi:hypothetical protein